LDGSAVLVAEPLDLPTFYDDQPSIYENSVEKSLMTAGSNLELEFSITSSRFPITSESRIIIVFPIYYIPSLSKDGQLSCFYNDVQISCFLAADRTLEIRYIKETIPIRRNFIIKVTGVT
jgi:hypothetical protein